MNKKKCSCTSTGANIIEIMRNVNTRKSWGTLPRAYGVKFAFLCSASIYRSLGNEWTTNIPWNRPATCYVRDDEYQIFAEHTTQYVWYCTKALFECFDLLCSGSLNPNCNITWHVFLKIKVLVHAEKTIRCAYVASSSDTIIRFTFYKKSKGVVQN